MVHSTLALGCMLIGAVALWGWGRVVVRIAGFQVTVPVGMAVGMAVIIFVGGGLNLLRVAYGPVLDGMLVAGVGFAVREFIVSSGRRWNVSAATFAATLPIAGATFLLLKYLTPPTVFNWHDDLERYFSYPVRMLATGTVGGNPLGYMGADSLGAQAFLQGFACAHFSIGHVGTLDWVFALLLCMVMAGFGIKPTGWAIGSVLAELLVFAINPLVVNVSSTFTTAFLISGLVFLTGTQSPSDGRKAWLIGLLYAAILALKTTNVVFVGLHFVAYVLTTDRSTRTSIVRLTITLGGTTLAFLAPWVLTHAANFFAALRGTGGGPATSRAVEPLLLFARALGSYGAAPFHYTALAVTSLLAGVFVWMTIRRSSPAARQTARAMLAASAAAAGAFFCLTVWLAPLVFGQIASFRYAVPVLLGVGPVIVRLVEELPLRFGRVAIGIGFAALLTLFVPSAIARIGAILESRMTLAFLSSKPVAEVYAKNYSAYVREALGEKRRDAMARIQAIIPAGEPIVAWVMLPYLFDFRRNPIFNLDPYGLAMPWVRLPKAKYFVWEHTGLIVRNEKRYQEMMADAGASERLAGSRALAFIRELERSVNTSERLYNDGTIAVWRTRD